MDEYLVLVVEDDDNLRGLLQAVMGDLFGISTVGAADGEEALRLVREKRPSLILLDIWLPGKDGLQVVRELKSDVTTRDIPVIALTASAARDSVMAVGCAEYVRKPFDIDYLVALVQDYLRTPVSIVCV